MAGTARAPADRWLQASAAVAVMLLLAFPWLVVWVPFLQGKASFWIQLVGLNLIYVILVMSLNLAMGYTGLLSLVQTGLLAIGGYASGAMVVKAGIPFLLALPIAIALAVVFAVVVVLVSVRATYLYFGMITFAFDLFIVELAREWDEVTNGFFGLTNIPSASVAGYELSAQQMYLLVLVVTLLAYLLVRNVVLSSTGRAFQAVRESDQTAEALGIAPARTKVLSFALAGGLAGVAGVLFAHQQSFMEPSVGLLENALFLFVSILLGGIGTLAGPVLGMGGLVVVDRLIIDFSEYRRLILGAILLLALMLVPRGIVGTWKASRIGSRPEEAPESPAVTEETGHGFLDMGGTMPEEMVIEARAIDKAFGGIRALEGVDLVVHGQEIHGIIGPNGSGKSTLVNCITAYLPQDAGEIRIFGGPRPDRPWKVATAGISRVFQTPHLFERVSVLDNVLTGMHQRASQGWIGAALRSPSFRHEEERMRTEALGLLRFAGMGDLAFRQASTLPHGQKRLLEVMRAVATRPRVLVLDEPATGLTSEEVEALAGLIQRLRRSGLAVVLIEHNMAFVMRLCDTITVLDGGRVIATGAPADIQESEAVRTAYLGVPAVAGS